MNRTLRYLLTLFCFRFVFVVFTRLFCRQNAGCMLSCDNTQWRSVFWFSDGRRRLKYCLSDDFCVFLFCFCWFFPGAGREVWLSGEHVFYRSPRLPGVSGLTLLIFVFDCTYSLLGISVITQMMGDKSATSLVADKQLCLSRSRAMRVIAWRNVFLRYQPGTLSYFLTRLGIIINLSRYICEHNIGRFL